MTLKLNTDNGLQGRTTEHQPVTAVWRNGGFSASYDSFVVGSSAVLRLNFCAKNPPLRQAAKRYLPPYIVFKHDVVPSLSHLVKIRFWLYNKMLSFFCLRKLNTFSEFSNKE
ncbi:MAG: hypothetical protein IPO86_00055 [Saprospiraceae bacterium]|nr:hypothetical protein [Saprospiraceae bacterium]